MDEGRSICLTLSFSRRPVGDAGCRATVVMDVEHVCIAIQKMEKNVDSVNPSQLLQIRNVLASYASATTAMLAIEPTNLFTSRS